MLYYYKSVLLLCAILVFIMDVTKGRGVVVFLTCVLIFSPVLTGSWRAVVSHGLWFPSLVLIFSAPYVFKVITNGKSLRSIDLVSLFCIAVLVSAGKVSTGFMFSVFIGFSLWFSFFRDWRIYVFGFLLIGFFWTYQINITVSKGLSVPDWSLFEQYLFLVKSDWGILKMIYIIFACLLLIYISTFSKKCFKILGASFCSIIVLGVLYAIQPDLIKSDRWFFANGLYFNLILVGFQIFTNVFLDSQLKFIPKSLPYVSFCVRCALIVLIAFASVINNSFDGLLGRNRFDVLSAKFYDFKHFYNELKDGFYRNIKQIEGLERVQVGKLFADREFIAFDSYERPLKRFRDSLHNFIESNDLRVSDTLLLVPREVFEESLSRFGGDDWCRGLLLYAVTGVPLLNGVHSLHPHYGFSDYYETETLLSNEAIASMSFDDIEKNVVIVEDFSEGKFRIIN